MSVFLTSKSVYFILISISRNIIVPSKRIQKGGLIVKKSVFFLFMLSVILMLVACSESENEEDHNNIQNKDQESGENENQEDEANDEQITLRMTWWGSQSRHDQTKEIIELFEEQNPDIKINTEFTGWDGYFEKMSAAAAGNNLPDIMQQNFGEYLNQYADKELLTDLTPFIEDGTIDLEGVSDTVIESGTQGGQVLGIPTGTNALTAIYNKTMLEEAGVEVPDHNWTWSDHDEIARQVHEETGEFGTRSLEPGNMFEYYLRQNGYRLFNEDGSDLGYDDDQILVDYFTMGMDLIEDDVAPGPDVIQQIQGLEDELIVHGKAPFDFRWSNQLGAIAGAATDQEFEMTLLPGEDNVKGMYLKPAMLWSISESSEYKEEAARFINFFVNTLEVYEIGGSDRGVPIKEDIRDSLSADLNEIDKKVFDYIDLVTDHSSPIDSNFPSVASEVLSALEDVDELVRYGELTPEEGAEHFREEATRILNR